MSQYHDINPQILMALNLWAIKKQSYHGSFVERLLKNDLSGTLSYADDESRRQLFLIHQYVYNVLTSLCHGSIERYNDWRDGKTDFRMSPWDSGLVWPRGFDHVAEFGVDPNPPPF
jgi:hypothetical protein